MTFTSLFPEFSLFTYEHAGVACFLGHTRSHALWPCFALPWRRFLFSLNEQERTRLDRFTVVSHGGTSWIVSTRLPFVLSVTCLGGERYRLLMANYILAYLFDRVCVCLFFFFFFLLLIFYLLWFFCEYVLSLAEYVDSIDLYLPMPACCIEKKCSADIWSVAFLFGFLLLHQKGYWFTDTQDSSRYITDWLLD